MNINMNGDSFATLREQAVNLNRAVNDMRSALAKATPHGRNYQPDQAGYDADRLLHTEALFALNKIRSFSDHFMSEVARQMP